MNEKKSEMRLTCVTLVATLLVLHHAASDKGGQLCKTPRGQMGNCRNVKSCKILLDIVDIYGHSAGDFLRGTMCDGDGSEILVCCPSLADDNRKDNGGRDDNKNETDTGKKVNSTYGPLVAPVCGSTVSYQRTHGHKPYGKKVICPWCSWLGYFGYSPPSAVSWECAGSLISSRYVLTAAYCAYERPDLSLARVGSHDPESDADGVSWIDVFIEKATVHPLFNIRTRANDIAVLRLQGDIEFTGRIHPICLPVTYPVRSPNFIDIQLDQPLSENAKLSGLDAEELRALQVPVRAVEWCEYYLGNFENMTIDERIICITQEPSNDSNCRSPTGYYLSSRFEGFAYLLGALSVGYRCHYPGYPDVYTRVTSFLDFIEAQLN